MAVALAACGGGGGGGGIRPVDFTTFSAVEPGQAVTARGMAQTANATFDSSGFVSATAVNAPDFSGVAKFTYGPSTPLTLTALEISTTQGGVIWNDGRGGQTVGCVPEVCSATASSAVGVVVNALGPLAWNYQTFGYWLQDTGATTGIAGVVSVGTPTPDAAIPIGGTASYVGVSGGIYIDNSFPGALSYEHAAVFSAAVDFGARTVDISTSGTQIALTSGAGGLVAAPYLDITTKPAHLNYAPATNLFSGEIISGGGYMSGTATGRFYGPGAEEIGGTFRLINSGSVTESAIGAFGGKR
jgi:hypothetical protein